MHEQLLSHMKSCRHASKKSVRCSAQQVAHFETMLSRMLLLSAVKALRTPM